MNNNTQPLTRKERERLLYIKNKEQRRQAFKEQYQKNKEQLIEYQRQYYLNNKAKHIALVMKRNKTNPMYKLRSKLHNRLYMALKTQKTARCEKTTNLLGCSVKQLKEHLESQFVDGMSWSNYSIHGWHIDHIKPCCTFDLTDPEQQRQCFHYTNLRPLWAKDNLSRPKDGSDLKE